MAGNNIKGLTVEIGGDTTKLGQALESVNKKSGELSKELGQINRLLKLDPGNTELLAQKQKVLAEAISNTRSKLDTLREAEKQVQAQFEKGEVTEEQYRELQREIIATENKLKGYEKAAKETSEQVANMGKNTEEAAKKAEAMNKASDAISKGLKVVAAAAAAAVAGLTKLTVDAAKYADTVLTESTVTGIATDKLQEYMYAAELVDVSTDTLTKSMGKQIKSMDSARDGSKAMADAYKTLGVSVTNADGSLRDGQEVYWEVIDALGKVENETERDAIAMQILGKSAQELNPLIAAGSEKMSALAEEAHAAGYVLSEETLQAYGGLDDQLQRLQANATAAGNQLGAILVPVLADLAELGVELLQKVGPATEWIKNNLPTIAAGLASITAGLVAFKVAQIAATAAAKGLTLAQYASEAAQKALNLAMEMNPIGLVVTAIGLLVTAFIYLWNNVEEFRDFWINTWEAMKTIVGNVVEWFKQLPQNIYNAIRSAIDRVAEWGAGLRDKAKQAASNMVSTVVNGIKELPNKIKEVGSNLISGLWNGINNKLSWLKDKIKSFTSSVLGSIKNFFGVHSPSKETAWIGDMLDQGLAEGLEDNINDPVKAMKRVSAGVLDAANNVDGIGLERGLRTSAATTVAANYDSSMGAKLDQILTAIKAGQILTIDGNTWVGATADKYDSVLGQRRMLVARGAL